MSVNSNNLPGWADKTKCEPLKSARFIHLRSGDETPRIVGTVCTVEVEGTHFCTFALVSKVDQGSRAVGRQISFERMARFLSFGNHTHQHEWVPDYLVREFDSEYDLKTYISQLLAVAEANKSLQHTLRCGPFYNFDNCKPGLRRVLRGCEIAAAAVGTVVPVESAEEDLRVDPYEIIG